MPTKSSDPGAPSQPAKRSKKQLFYYTFGLLAVALLLLVFSYVTHLRSSEQTIDTLEQEKSQVSVSAMASIQSLTDENRSLKEKTAAQESEIARLREELDGSEENTRKLEQSLKAESEQSTRSSNLAIALNSVWYLSRAYNRRDYDKVREILLHIENNIAPGIDMSADQEGRPIYADEKDKTPFEVYNEIMKIMDSR